MKACLTYNLDKEEDAYSFTNATKGIDYRRALEDIRDFLREKCKYADLSQSEYAMYSTLREEFFNLLADYDINLE